MFKFFKIGNMFDLKGSTAKRDTLTGDQRPKDLKGVAMKDNDFKKHFNSLTFMSAEEESSEPYSAVEHRLSTTVMGGSDIRYREDDA